MKHYRMNLVNGTPEVSDTSDAMWAVAESNGWRVYAALGESTQAVCSKFVKAEDEEKAILYAGNPFGGLSTNGWRKED